MEKVKIENPKVFISYAWGSDEYQEKVLSFATQLMSDGVDVVLDKWNLSEGNDTYSFMEKCATDSSISNVLMLLDPTYSKKADAHEGGVGTETQIISAKVYQEVEQSKFIPIVFERAMDGSVCKPTYLQGRLHFDLSLPDKYDDEYMRLVKSLYGVAVYPKPERGSKPAWVEQKKNIPIKRINEITSALSFLNERTKKEKYKEIINNLGKEMNSIVESHAETSLVSEEIVSIYQEFEPIRDTFLLYVKNSIYIDHSVKIVAEFLEDSCLKLRNLHSLSAQLAKVFVHEMFLYTVAFYAKNKEYDNLGYILGKSYFYGSFAYGQEKHVCGYHIFYAGAIDLLDNAMKYIDNKNYYSGTATYWINHIDKDFCSKEEFVLADQLCYNYSLYGKDYLDDYPWFPLTYVYDNEYDSVIERFSHRLMSREYADEIKTLFNFESIESLKGKMREVETDYNNGMLRDYRYSQAFESARLLCNFIKSDNVGTVR